MAINGIQSLIYGVEDVERCTDFFADFGLPLERRDATASCFRLAEGSAVIVRRLQDAKVEGSAVDGCGVQETILGVDSAEQLASLADQLSRDRHLGRDADGTVHFLTDCGLPLGLRVYDKRPVPSAPDPVNSPGRIERLNRQRRWLRRATPKTIQHVVFAVQDFEASFRFLRERLNFRVSDYQPGLGLYARCDGTLNHHNIFLLNAHAHVPGMDRRTRFHHANFGVEDIDEIMAGANYMTRRGWPPSQLGLGRHRTDSALFYYLPCPAGGEAEYGADADYVDDAWMARYWTSPLFGYLHFAHNLPPFLADEPAWEFRYLTEDDLDSARREREQNRGER
jgi:catechol 2,3-dioxygenase-like lactoylglutathione lyase family enzyme